MKVLHVITGLQIGGAERMLFGVTSASRTEVDSVVVCLGIPGPMSQKLVDAGIPLHHVGMRSLLQSPTGLQKVRRIARELRPDVIQGWMYHGNLAALMASRGTQAAVAWNIRQSLHRRDLFKATTRLMIKANAALSRRVDSIIYNSQIARRQHEAIGFYKSVGTRIPNGIDLERFSDSFEDRVRVRQELGIANNEKVVIAVGRVHAIKGHDTLLKAIESTIAAEPNTRFVIAGRGANWDQHPFAEIAADSLLRRHILLLDERDDIPSLLAAADLFVSASYTEGFPNAVAEAMASGLPSVVTDVGDSRLLVGEHGIAVPASNADALAAGLLNVLRLDEDDRRKIGSRARTVIERDYSLPTVANMYVNHYRQYVNGTIEELSA